MYAQLCNSTNEIFTSVVVYSRTTKTSYKTTKKLKDFDKLESLNLFWEARGVLFRKKNRVHMYVCTTVQLVKRNIHVGCCLFSHKIKNKNNKKKKKWNIDAPLCKLFDELMFFT